MLISAAAIAGLLVAALLRAPWWFFAAMFGVTLAVGTGWPQTRRPSSRPNARVSPLMASNAFLVPSELPLPPSPFIGRNHELSQMTEYITSSRPNDPRLIMISGPAGIGKTALALHFAHAVATRFPDGQLFAELGSVDAGGREVPESIEASFIEALQGPDEIVPSEQDERHRRYSDLTRKRHVLIVIDDARDDTETRGILPADSSCLVVVTSRAPILLARDQLDVSLEALADQDSLSLLDAMLGGDRVNRDLPAARQIVKNSRGYPLAVRMAGASLAPRQYWGLGRAALRLDEEERQLAQPGPLHSWSGILDMSYVLLTEDERSALRLLGLRQEPAFEPWMLAAIMDVDIPAALRLAESLIRERFIERISEDSDEALQFRIHDQVYAYARIRMHAETSKAEQEACLRRLQQASAKRLAHVPSEQLRKNVFRWQDEGKIVNALDAARDILSLAHLKGDKEAEGLARAALAELYLELGYIDDARELSMAALGTAGIRGRPRALRSLGKVKRRLRQIRSAEALLTQAYDLSQELRDGSEQIRILRELAAVQALGDEPLSGAATARQAIQMCDQRADRGRRLRAGVLWSLGSSLLYADDLTSAEEAFQEAEQFARQAEQNLWTAWIGQGLSRVTMESEDYDRSKVFVSDALSTFRDMRHRYGIAHCRLLLGEIFRAEGDFEDAARILEEALETFQNCGDPWMTGVAMQTLALNRGDQGYATDAADLVEQAYKIFEVLAEDHPPRRSSRFISPSERTVRTPRS